MIKSISHNGTTIFYELERAKRKTLTVRVTEDGKIIVKSPKWLTGNYIESFLISKFDWIITKTEESQKRSALTEIEYKSGSIIHALDNDYILEIRQGKRNQIRINDNYLAVTASNTDEDYIHKLVLKWRNDQLKNYIEARISQYLPIIVHYSELMNNSILPISKISVKNVKTRWGSCSSRGSLNFSSRLSVAPLSLTDYVIVHEMCHLIYMNHSADFWGAVAYVIPDYNIRKKQLRENGWKYQI